MKLCTFRHGDATRIGVVLEDGVVDGGVGAARKPMQFLVAGDVVRVEIEGRGAIENHVIAEPDTASI